VTLPASTGFWKAHVAYTASQTAQTIHAPASGRTVYVEGFIVQPTASGTLTIFDNTDSASTRLFSGTLPAGLSPIIVTPTKPIPLSAANNILKFSSGSASTGDVTAFGFES
jgi:hypothetical protein